MAINEIQGSPNLDPSRVNQGNKLKSQSNQGEDKQKVTETAKGQDKLEVSELAKYASLVEGIPTPNEGRIAELKNDYLVEGKGDDPKVIDATADIITGALI